MSDRLHKAILTTARIAYRHRGAISESELNDVLVVLVEVGGDEEAAQANDALFHLRKSQEAQLKLASILDQSKGGAKPARDHDGDGQHHDGDHDGQKPKQP